MFFVRHTAGFLVQLLPCVVLCMSAFRKEQYRIPLKLFSVIGGMIMFGISLGFAYVLYTVRGDMAASMYYTNIIMSVTAILCVVCFMVVISAHIVQKLMTLCVYVTYSAMVYNIVNIIQICWPQIGCWTGEIYSWPGLLFFLGVTAVTFPFMYLFVRKVLATYFEDTDLKQLKRGAVLLLAVTAGFFLIFETGIFLDADSKTDEIFWLGVAYSIFSVFCIGIIYWFLFWEIRNVRKQENVLNLLEIQQLQYEKLQADVQNTFRIQHDIRQQYRVLAGLLSENKLEEALLQLQKGSAFFGEIEQKQFCRNPGLNALFQYYSSEAERMGISLHITTDALPNRIDDVALTILLGNMLENAVFSCKNAREPQYIHLKMGMVKNIFAIYMENTCEEVRMTGKGKRNEQGYCAASSFGSLKSGRGFGLKSMEAIAEKYDGTAEFCFLRPVFYTRISMKDE